MDISSLLAMVTGLLTVAAAKFPIITAVFTVMGILRAVFKPLSTYVHSVIADPAIPASVGAEVQKVEASGAYKAFAFILDYATSIKIINPNK